MVCWRETGGTQQHRNILHFIGNNNRYGVLSIHMPFGSTDAKDIYIHIYRCSKFTPRQWKEGTTVFVENAFGQKQRCSGHWLKTGICWNVRRTILRIKQYHNRWHSKLAPFLARPHTHTHTLQCIELIQSHWWMSPNGKSARISHENSLNLSVIDGKTSEPWTWSAMDTLPPALYIWATQQHSKQHNNREPRARWLSVIRDCCVKACGCTECTVFMQHTDWFCSLLLIIRTGKKTYWKWCVLSRCALEHWQLERARNHSEWKFIDYIFFQILWTTQRNGIPIMPR